MRTISKEGGCAETRRSGEEKARTGISSLDHGGDLDRRRGDAGGCVVGEEEVQLGRWVGNIRGRQSHLSKHAQPCSALRRVRSLVVLCP
jgi:hypothetical protein